MPLRFDRFRHFPESGKTATLLLGSILGFYLCFVDVHYPTELRFFWSVFWMSFFFDIITIIIILKEWDENVDWIRKAPYSIFHCLTLLIMSFLIFVSAILFLVSENYSGDGVLFVGGALCFLIFGIRMACIFKDLPKLRQDIHFPDRPSNADYENEGTAL